MPEAWSRIISFYLLHFICAIVFAYLFLFVSTSKTATIPLKSDTPAFNSTADPVWITQLSDIHVASHFNVSVERFKKYLTFFKNHIFPAFTLLSGDLVDNYEDDSPPTMSEPFLDQWVLYNDTIAQSGVTRSHLFEVLGNHDIWGLFDFKEGESWASIYTTTKRDHFFAYSGERNGVRLVGFVPQDFPTGHGALGFCPPIRKEMLDKLEEVLNRPSNTSTTIVSMHFTTELVFPLNTKSTSGKTLFEILETPQYKVAALLNGHTHPKAFEPLHIGTKMIEVTATALLRVDKFGLITVDNDRMTYSALDEKNLEPAVITCPSPAEQSKYIFPDTSFDIRVLSFSSNQSRRFVVSGDATGIMTFTREVMPGVCLYSLPATFTAGKHTITISGDIDKTIEFGVNSEVGPIVYTRTVPLIHYSGIVGFCLFFILYVISIVFMYLPDGLVPSIDEATKWVQQKSEISHWVLVCLAGPAIEGKILSKRPKWERILLTVILLWPIVLPCLFFSTDDHFSILWLYGFFVNFKHTYDVFSQLVGAVYLFTVAKLFIDMIALLEFEPSKSFIFDGVFHFIQYCIGYFFWWRYGGDIGPPCYWGISFQFVLIPLSMIGLIVYLNYKKYGSEQPQEDNIVTP